MSGQKRGYKWYQKNVYIYVVVKIVPVNDIKLMYYYYMSGQKRGI